MNDITKTLIITGIGVLSGITIAAYQDKHENYGHLHQDPIVHQHSCIEQRLNDDEPFMITNRDLRSRMKSEYAVLDDTVQVEKFKATKDEYDDSGFMGGVLGGLAGLAAGLGMIAAENKYFRNKSKERRNNYDRNAWIAFAGLIVGSYGGITQITPAEMANDAAVVEVNSQYHESFPEVYTEDTRLKECVQARPVNGHERMKESTQNMHLGAAAGLSLALMGIGMDSVYRRRKERSQEE